jgi:AcrR family transcriptional regulator
MSAGANGPEQAVLSVERQGAHVAEMQRRRLLSAMVEVIGERGLEDAGVGRVCKRAGVSRRTFYDLFGDREACFLAAFELAIEQLTDKVAPAYARDGRWSERVRSALAVMLESFDQEPGLARLCLVETLKGGREVLERRRQVLATLTAVVDEGRDEAKRAQPPPLTAESTVGGAIAVIHARLLESDVEPAPPRVACEPTGLHMGKLLNPLMSMIVHPYLGSVASGRELDRPVSTAVARAGGHVSRPVRDPFKDLSIRITFRTARVLAVIAAQPDASNREIGHAAGVEDQGQISKLLRRLEKPGLIENHGEGQVRGESNAWRLTAEGHSILRAVGHGTSP